MSILPCGRSLEIPRGREVLKGTLLGEKYEVKLEFFFLVGGWGGGGLGAKQKKPSMGDGYFLEPYTKTKPLLMLGLNKLKPMAFRVPQFDSEDLDVTD